MTSDTMPLSEALGRLCEMTADLNALVATWCEEHAPRIAAELGLPRAEVERRLAAGLERFAAQNRERCAVACADLELVADPDAGLDAVPERWRAG